jgi:F0F1-type ATP synthase delta subunit
MFPKARWAEAFLHFTAAATDDGIGSDCREALAFLAVIAQNITKMPGNISGLRCATEMDRLLGKAIEAAAYQKSGGIEAARALVFLLIKRGEIHELGQIIEEITRLAETRASVLTVRLDAATQPERAFLESLVATLKTRTRAKDVHLQVKLMPELLGGCRLSIGSEMEDYSIAGELQQLTEKLTHREREFF